MDKQLKGTTAFVTGSGRGLGRGIADRLAELGADVAIHARDWTGSPSKYGEYPDLGAVAREIQRHGGRTVAVTGDISDRNAVARMAAEIRRDLGEVNLLVNCAGGDIGAAGGKPNPNDALHVSLEDVRALIDNNLIGTMLPCQEFCPAMVERGAGCVINITSVVAHFGTTPEVAYASIKAAVVHYTRCLASELRAKGVRVNAVSPGPSKTARFVSTRKVDPAMMTVGNSLVRYAEPAEISDVVAFLAGPQARFVSGQILRVDGGMSLYAG